MMKTARKQKSSVPLESAVLKESLAALASMGVKGFRRNIAAMSGEHKGKRWFFRSGAKGQSDTYGWFPRWCQRPGVHFEAECKRPGETPTLDQIMWLREANMDAGTAFWFDSAATLRVVMEALLNGGRVVYHDGESSYPNPVKGGKGRVMGPSYEFDVEL